MFTNRCSERLPSRSSEQAVTYEFNRGFDKQSENRQNRKTSEMLAHCDNSVMEDNLTLLQNLKHENC
jgi:hypothetical protein